MALPKGVVAPFPWFGGKSRYVPDLKPLLPNTTGYTEVFGGSAALLVSRDPSPVETYNDLNGDVAHFFRTLRDHEDELLRRIQLTEVGRGVFEDAIDAKADPPDDDVQRAWYFLIRTTQAFNARPKARHFSDWSYQTTVHGDHRPQSVSKWRARLDNLEKTANRLLNVQIESRPALEVIDTYDKDDQLLYLDPPYVPETRENANEYGDLEMSRDDHVELADRLQDVDAKVAISGYPSDLYLERFDQNGWERHVIEGKWTPKKGWDDEDDVEVVWTNYPVPDDGFGSRDQSGLGEFQ